jgi:lysophospholipase L1-like esterase
MLMLVLLEAGLAILRITPRLPFTVDPDVGSHGVPGASYVNTKEGFSAGRFNSMGYRDRERTFAKPPGAYRIAVIGDSYVEALQVPIEAAFPARLEAQLNRLGGPRRYEVIALGQSGSGTADAYVRYRRVAARYAPDLVVYAFCKNDVRNNSRALNLEVPGFYFVPAADGALRLDASLLEPFRDPPPLRRLYQALKRNSYLLSLVSDRVYLARTALRARELRGALARTTPATGTHVDEFSDRAVFRTPPSARWGEALRITEGALLELKNAVEGGGARFLLLLLSSDVQVDPALQEEMRRTYQDDFDFTQPDRQLEELCKTRSVEYLNLTPLFHEAYERDRVLSHGFGGKTEGHWNENGHRLAAEALFDFLRERGIVGAAD